ncbi:unannotated protein [freshwater metagenome]|uniref:Unannotated protein n=1 Tax=freshwater metagenome TaxID=449393 RepID=A0A6J6PGK2_9ZZZZ
MVQRGHHRVRPADPQPVGGQRRSHQRHVGGIGERRRVQLRVVRQVLRDPEPELLPTRALGVGRQQVVGAADIAEVDDVPLVEPAVLAPDHRARIDAVRGGRHRRHRVLVLAALGRALEVGGHHEDRAPVLTRQDPSGGERASVPQRLDVVDDRHRGVARLQEVGVQRVHGVRRVHRPVGGDQRLRRDLTAEDPRQHRRQLDAPEEVVVDRLQIQQGHQLVGVAWHLRGPGRRSQAPRDRRGTARTACRSPRPSAAAGPRPAGCCRTPRPARRRRTGARAPRRRR